MSCSSAPSSSSSGPPARARDDRLDVDLVPGLEPLLARVEQARALRDRLEQVTVDGVAVVRVALRPRAHVLPLREQPGRARLRGRAPRTPAPRRSPERRSRTKPARCHTSQVGSPVAAEPRQRRAVERHAVLGRRARGLERAQRRDRTVGVGVDVHAAVAQPHAFGDGLVGRRALRARPVEQVADAATTRRPRSTRSRAPRCARSCTSASADAKPSCAATASCSCSASRSECEPVTRCSATRMSSSSSRPVSTRARSAAVEEAALDQRRAAARARPAPSRPTRTTARRADRPRLP